MPEIKPTIVPSLTAGEIAPSRTKGFTRWQHPSLPPQSLARERSIAKKYTRVTAVVCSDWPDCHQAWLTVGPQHFPIGAAMETRDEAEWQCWMLAKAMIAVIDAAVSGNQIEGPVVS
jgi:hypothetical protein